MSTPHKKQLKPLKPNTNKANFSQQVGEMAQRKLKAQKHVSKTIWAGLGMIGLIGWSVVVPTLLGAAVGGWLDTHYPSEHHWTLILLIAGLCIGCFIAWHWVEKEDHEIHHYGGEDDTNRMDK